MKLKLDLDPALWLMVAIAINTGSKNMPVPKKGKDKLYEIAQSITNKIAQNSKVFKNCAKQIHDILEKEQT